MYNKKLAILIVFFVIIICGMGVNTVFATDNLSMSDLSTNLETQNTVSDISIIDPSYDVTNNNALKKDTSTGNITQKNTNKYNNINNKQKQEETNNTIKTTTNTNIINTNTKTTGTGNFTELEKAINDTDSGGTLKLTQNYTRTTAGEYQEGILINKTITINGDGYTIDGTNNGRIFSINSKGKLTLNNITLTNGQTAADGGAIYNGGTLTINNCTLTHNTVTGKSGGYGGAIYNGGTLTINNCTLTHNNATASEQISYGGGGAIYNGGTLTITNSILTHNNATGAYCHGGAISNNGGGTITITNSTLTYNTATGLDFGWGGAIYNYGGTINITNSTLTNNTATGQRNGEGGAIYNTDNGVLCVVGSVFLNNTANMGSAVYKLGGSVVVDGNWWGSNDPSWSNLLSGMGNGPNSFVVVNFTNCSVYNGKVVRMGVYSYLKDNTSQVCLPLREVSFISKNGIFSPTSTNFTGNTTTIYTGKPGELKATIDNQDMFYPLKDLNNSFSVLESLINDNINGTIILTKDYVRSDNETNYIDGITINKNITIEGNGFTIDGTSLNGTTGRIFQIKETCNLTLNNLTLTGGNHSAGGAIYNHNGTINIRNSILTQNNATATGQDSIGYGGVIYNVYGGININNCTLTQNTVTGQNIGAGGVIYNLYGEININNCTLTQNNATGQYSYGGVIYNNDGDLKVSGSVFLNNTAYNSGSAVYNLSGNVVVDGNWWGSNDPSWSNLLGDMSDPSNFVMMTFTSTSVYAGGCISLRVSLNTLNNSSLVDGLPLREVVLTTDSNGSFTNNNTNFTKSMESNYTGGRGVLKAIVDGCEEIIDLTRTSVSINETSIQDTFYGESPIVNAIVIFTDGQEVTCGNVTFIITKPDMTIQEYTTTLNNSNIAKLNITDINSYTTGTYNITVKYTSTNNSYNNSINNTKKQWNVIPQVNTNLSLSIQPLIISPTRLVKIIPNLTPTNATGNIEYYLDGTYYQTGNTYETIILTNISIGKHNITGTYTGNTQYKNSTDTIYFTVESDITFTIDVLTSPFYIGDNITIVPYLPDNATGTITYILDGKIITKTNKIHENKTLNELPLGEYTLIASYSGDTQYVESIVTTNFTINKIPTTILIDPIVAQAGDNIQITANITNTRNQTITGLVAFKLNGHTIGKTNTTNGQAILNYTIPNTYTSKNYTITVIYGENNIFTKATTNTTLTLTKKQAKIQITPIKGYAGTTIQLTTNITDMKGTPLNTGTIVYKINQKTIGKTNITNGKATLEYKIPDNYTSKNYTITAVLSDKNYQRTETNTTLTLQKTPTNITTNPLIIPEKTPFTITAKITNNQTQKPLTNGKTGIKINQKTLTNNLTPDKNGIITYTINNNTYKKGTHNITIMYGETKNNQETRTQTTLTII
ncbi:MAG: hypothetical protein Q4Q23_04025 [Methanobacteriaceae archaeon]|nr:hypothetical protein [Methanobacteriaceae archaeon]